MAKAFAPSIIFIDEVEGLASKRDTCVEAARRFRNEFAKQIDELEYGKSNVALLAITNLPW